MKYLILALLLTLSAKDDCDFIFICTSDTSLCEYVWVCK